jgi:ribosomal protein L30E
MTQEPQKTFGQKVWSGVVKAGRWFNGKKSAISIIGLGACQLAVVKNNVDPDVLEAMNFGFTILGGVGIIHRDLKSDKSIIRKVNDSINKNIKKPY